MVSSKTFFTSESKSLDDLKAGLKKTQSELATQKNLLNQLVAGRASLLASSQLNARRMADWIDHFEKALSNLESKLHSLEITTGVRLNGVSSRLEVVETSLRRAEPVASSVHSAVAEGELMVFDSDSKLKPIINVNNVDNVNNVMPGLDYNALSNSEKWLVGVLFGLENPFSYAQLAQKTGKSLNTLRVYMNQLKTRGFVEESVLPNGVKIFGLKQAAKVKKLYNL